MDRPLIGEPLPLDLLNTSWVDSGRTFDLLALPDGVTEWLRERRLLTDASPHDLSGVLRETREAMRHALLANDQPAAYDALNAILARGRVRDRLGPGGPESVVEVDDERWRIAWTAAHELITLLRTKSGRVRKCGADECILWFLDTTRSANKRWCSMQACGNRTKVRRHRDRGAAMDGCGLHP